MSLTEPKIFETILQEFEEFQKSLICTICQKRCEDPVRIKVCGHYFCESCLKTKEEHICPQCKQFYAVNECCGDNLARRTEPLLCELKQILLSSVSNQEIPNTKYPSFECNTKIISVKFVDKIFNKKNKKGETGLHVACKRKKLGEVVGKLETDIDFNTQDFAGWTPLHEAVQSGNLDIVELLLKHNVLIDVPGEEYITPLHKAAALGNEKIITVLLKHGADRDALDYSGKKAVDYACNDNICLLFESSYSQTKHIQCVVLSKTITVFCYFIEVEWKRKLLAAKVKIEEEYDPKKVTHFIIRKTHKPSFKMLLAMLNGCMIVPQEWIDCFLKDDLFIPIPSYTFINHETLNGGIQRAILNSLFKLPKLFDGMHFFICQYKEPIKIMHMKITKEILSSLITSGGGKILHRSPTPRSCEDFSYFPYHANKNASNFRCCHYILYDEANPPLLQYTMPEIKHRSYQWVIKCIINFTILD